MLRAVDGSGDPSERLALRAVVAGLPRRQREAVVLRYLVDLSVSETAAVMGCAEGTVRALTSQALSSLRTQLGPTFENGDVDA